ncbi:MAG: 4-hydroxythreonine-4-phosphate dehydrogenase PdxA [Treponemataceae bacterium]|nr:4-hydroxythreonine-4-phosphate dehydrogenase PdxA [Treponemataceae bacterium]
MNRPLIAVTMGDPAGIGPEVVVKALCKDEVYQAARTVVIGDASVLERVIGVCGLGAQLNVIENITEAAFDHGVINVFDLNNCRAGTFKPGESSAQCGKACFEYVQYAARLAMSGLVDAITTSPINKTSLKVAQVPYIGHTEMLAAFTSTPDPLTLFEVQGLRIFFLSRHVSLRKACDLVKKDRIVDYVKRCTNALNQLGVENGSVAVAGLNPHSSDNGMFGNEEADEITPAVAELKAAGYNAVGPCSADSVYHLAHKGLYSSVLALYHDQGHIAAKTLDFERTIAITCDMPFLRTSVDHGTAYDIAWQNKANEVSMVEAILLAAKYGPAYKKN